jgi:hypothetical protein
MIVTLPGPALAPDELLTLAPPLKEPPPPPEPLQLSPPAPPPE